MKIRISPGNAPAGAPERGEGDAAGNATTDVEIEVGQALPNVALVDAERYATYCCLGISFDLGFGFGRAVPRTEEETSILNALFEFVVIVALKGVFFETFFGFVIT